MKKAVIVIPTYNEADNIEILIDRILSVSKSITNWVIDILVVDSMSGDGTGDIVKAITHRHHNVHLLSTKKEGLGKAYIAGFQYALEKLNAYVLFEMDADLSHKPEYLPQFLKEIEQGADFVIGSRYIKGGSIPQEWAFHRKLFSIFGNLIIRFGFLKLRITDWTDGYRAVKAWVIRGALSHITQFSGYVFQIALLDNALKQNANIREIPIHFPDRTKGVSKINSTQYITHIILYILTHSSFIKFVAVGGFGFILDFGISYLLIEKANWPIWVSTIISTETAIISNFILNNYWSFAHKSLERNIGVMIPSFIKFNVVSSGSILIQTLSIHFLAEFLGEQWWFVYKFFIILGVIIPYSYILYNKLIWKDKK